MSQDVRDVAFLKTDDPARRTFIAERASQATGLLSGEYFSPRESDSLAGDVALSSGAYVLVTVAPAAIPEHLGQDVGLTGGLYLPVVVSQNMSDSIALDFALTSGLYILVVRPTPLETDQTTLDGTLLSGTALTTVRIAGPINEQVTVNGTFTGGSYP